MEQVTPPGLPSGNDPALLPQVQGWNWGGFLLNWIWAFAHRLPIWGILALVLGAVVPLASLGFAIYFGVAGNDLAWRNRPFQSLQQFRDTERVWAYWGLAVVVLWALLVAAILFAILLPVFMRALQAARGS